MKCPKCSFENREGAKFCNDCGHKFQTSCPDCGAANRFDSKFCDECGRDLRARKKPSPVDYDQPQSYTPKHLADKILTTRTSIEGERKLVTVMFADVADFTSLSEKLDPEEVHQIMDGCFKILMEEIHRYEGTINQFTGDGVMALFGAPVAHEDHASRACHAALNIRKAVGDYGERISKDYGVPFRMRIGLNSGPVIVGAIGDDLRMDYTAVGDTTNLASRMEGMAQPGTVLLSNHTHRLVKDYFELRSLGQMELKGKREPHEAFELVKPGKVATRIGASVAKGLTRFVGRKNSMAALTEAWKKAVSGSGQVVGIVGEAGVGKSRLLHEMRGMIPQGEHTCLVGRCLHYGGSMPYLPILDILKSYFDVKEGDREIIIRKKMEDKILELGENLKSVLPPFQELLSLTVVDEEFMNLEPKKKRERTFEAIRDLMIRLSQDKPLILAVEDLHWIDKTSEEFLNYLIGWLGKSPIMLILLYRPEYTHQWGSKSYYTKIGLDQLGTQSSTELVQAILEEGEVATELRQLILNRAAGNPLFMEEFTQSLLENGSIERKDEKYVLSRKVSDIQVPDTIQGIIAARMDRLEENLKRTMQVASVIGRDFAFRILQSITGLREELKSYLLNLQGLEFIYEKRLFPELEYIFKHALTQEVAYNSLLSSRRREIHTRIGNAIENLYAENLEEFYEMLAYHYSKGEDKGKASHYLKLSAQKATRNHAPWEAYGFYKEAVDLLNRLPETEENRKERLELIEGMRIPAGLIGFPGDSPDYFELGVRLAKDLGDNRRLAVFYNAMASHYTFAGNHSRAVRFTEAAFKAAREIHDLELMVPLSYSLCLASLGKGQVIAFFEEASEVVGSIEQARRESDYFSLLVNPFALLCGLCGWAKGYTGRFDQGMAFMEKCLHHAEQAGEPATLGGAEMAYGFFLYVKGDWEPAKKHLEKARKYIEEAKWTMGLICALNPLAHVYSFLGDLEAGKRTAERNLQMYRNSGIGYLLSFNQMVLGEINLSLGNVEEARRFMEEALRLSSKNSEIGWEAQAHLGLGKVLSRNRSGDFEKAEESFLKGLAILEAQGLKPYYSQGCLFLGELYLDVGEKQKAISNLKQAEAMFQELGMDYWLTRTREVLTRL